MLVVVSGCGLINTDITKVRFALPSRTYQFNATGFTVATDNSVAIPCTTDAECLTTPFVCDTGVCTAVFPVTQHTEMNLKQEASELSGVTSVVDISIESISYSVTTNTLNVDLPPVQIFLAPSGVTDPADPRAMLFGTVPSVAAGDTASGEVILAANAGAVFKSFTRDLNTPFTFIAATTVKIASGSGIPSGQLVVSVTGVLSASL
jgi:hypothetical protein